MKEKKVRCKYCQAVNSHYSFQCHTQRKPMKVGEVTKMTWEQYQEKKNKAVGEVKKKKIPNISEKQKERLKRYRILRDAYMNEHKQCEARIEGCTISSQSLHHLKGRDGDNLFNHFMATCNHCHEKIERMGAEVYELGFKLKRTEK